MSKTNIACFFFPSLQHCIQGKTLFNPLLVRLDCGFTANNPHGRWEHDGFGPIATFKSDWDRYKIQIFCYCMTLLYRKEACVLFSQNIIIPEKQIADLEEEVNL